MPKQVEFEGVIHEFPDDFTDEDISLALSSETTPEKSVGGFLGNAVSSAGQFTGNMVSGLANAFNPDMEKNTVANVGKLGLGAAQLLVPGEQGYEDRARGVGQFYKDRYGSLDKLGNTLYTDPVGAIGDASMLLGGAGAGLKAVNLGKLGRAASTASRVTNPATAVTKLASGALQKVAPYVYRPGMHFTTKELKAGDEMRAARTGIQEGILPAGDRVSKVSLPYADEVKQAERAYDAANPPSVRPVAIASQAAANTGQGRKTSAALGGERSTETTAIRDFIRGTRRDQPPVVGMEGLSNIRKRAQSKAQWDVDALGKPIKSLSNDLNEEAARIARAKQIAMDPSFEGKLSKQQDLVNLQKSATNFAGRRKLGQHALATGGLVAGSLVGNPGYGVGLMGIIEALRSPYVMGGSAIGLDRVGRAGRALSINDPAMRAALLAAMANRDTEATP